MSHIPEHEPSSQLFFEGSYFCCQQQKLPLGAGAGVGAGPSHSKPFGM